VVAGFVPVSGGVAGEGAQYYVVVLMRTVSGCMRRAG